MIHICSLYQITATLNPGLDRNDTEITLIHIKADGSKDTVHQIWDFTQGIPTTIFAITSLNTTLNVTWDSNIKPKALDLSEKPIYSFAAVVDKVKYSLIMQLSHT